MSRSTLVSIGDLVEQGALDVSDGYRTKLSEHGKPGYRIVRVSDVLDDDVRLTGPDFVSRSYRWQIGSKLGQAGDVLLTTKGTVGRVAIMPETAEPVVYSPQLCYFRVMNETVILPRYLRYWFSSSSFAAQAADRMNNTDMAAYINLADIRSLTIDLPNSREQQGVGEVLGALDDKIAVNTKLARTACELAGFEYRRLTTGIESVANLKEILTLEYGKPLPASRREPGQVQVFGSGGIVGSHNESLRAEPGVVVGRKGTAGAVHWASGPHYPIDTTFYVLPKQDRVTDIFCLFALKSLRLSEMNSDSAVPGLNRNEAYAAIVRLPPRAEVESFSQRALELFGAKAQAEQESRTLAAMRDALLPHLMSGKLRVKDAEKIVSDKT